LTVILNNGANVLSIYPATGEKINGLANNIAITAAPGQMRDAGRRQQPMGREYQRLIVPVPLI
jgi:hypothetical protein